MATWNVSAATQTAPYTPRTKVPILVSEVTPADAALVAQIRIESLDDAHDVIRRHVFPAERRPSQDVRIARQAATLRRECSDSSKALMKATRADTGEIVGLAAWVRPGAPVEPPGQGGDEERAMMEQAGIDVEFLDLLVRECLGKRAQYFNGKDHWYLEVLTVATAHQGIGAGKALVRWAMDLADASDPPVELFLESSQAGRRLYEKLGFEIAYPCRVEWKGETIDVPAMIRRPRIKE